MSTIGYNHSVHYIAPARPARVAVRRDRVRLNRRGRIFFGTLAAIPFIVGAYFLGFGAAEAGAGSSVTTVSFEQVTVMPGESLWTIATTIAPNADAQQVIADIVSLNQLDSSVVQPGQRLSIPAEYSN